MNKSKVHCPVLIHDLTAQRPEDMSRVLNNTDWHKVQGSYSLAHCLAEFPFPSTSPEFLSKGENLEIGYSPICLLHKTIQNTLEIMLHKTIVTIL